MLDKFGRGVERGFQRLFTSNRRHNATSVDSIAVMQATEGTLPHRLHDSPVKIDHFQRFANRLANAAFQQWHGFSQYVFRSRQVSHDLPEGVSGFRGQWRSQLGLEGLAR